MASEKEPPESKKPSLRQYYAAQTAIVAAMLIFSGIELNQRGDVYERVKAQFSDAEIVELTLICAMFNMINRVNDSLDITIEEQPEIDKIKPSLVLDPERMRSYLRWLADHWPGDMDTLNREAEDAAAA